MKVFISQPMSGLTDEEIKSLRKKAVEVIEKFYPAERIDVLDTFFEGAPIENRPVWFLGKSIQMLSQADHAFFIGNWKGKRGCESEWDICERYDIPKTDWGDVVDDN